MIPEKSIRRELKRLPVLLQKAIKDKDFETVLELQHEIWTLEWILSDES